MRQRTVEIDTLWENCLQHIPHGFTHEPSEFCYNLLTRSWYRSRFGAIDTGRSVTKPQLIQNICLKIVHNSFLSSTSIHCL